ncbi:MAG: hypothetical protein AAF957_01365 [Planctomycetota bacterium]
MHRAVTFLVALALVACSTGCKSFRSKFSSKRKPNLAVFSEQSAALLDDADASLSELPFVRLRGLRTPDEAEEVRLRELTDLARRGRSLLIDLTVSLSRIPKDAPDEEQVAYLIKIVEDVLARLEAAGQFSISDSARDALQTMAERETLLEAAGDAAPILQVILERGRELANEIEDALNAVAEKIEDRIDERHRGPLERAQALNDERAEALSAVQRVWRARAGDPQAIEGLDQVLSVQLVGGLGPNDDGYLDLLQRVRDRAEWLDRVRSFVQSDLDAYYADHEELDRVHDIMRTRLNHVRIELIVWMVGYGRVTRGVVEPAEWFDASSALGTAGSVGRRVL